VHIIDLALKDLTQILRDRKSAIFLVLMPIVFTAFMGFAFRPSTTEDPRLPVGFVNNDEANGLSTEFRTLLEASNAIRPVTVEPKDAEGLSEEVRRGEFAAAVIVPAGFGAEAADGVMGEVTVIVDSTASTGQTALTAIRTARSRWRSSVQIAQLSVESVEAAKPFESEAERQAAWEAAAAQAMNAWREPPFGVTVEAASAAVRDEPQVPTAFNQSSPGMIVQFAIFGLVTSAMVLVVERKSRTLQRMLTTSVSRAEIIAGHMLAMFAVVFMQEIILVAVGQLGFGVNYLREPVAVLLVITALALWVASLGLFIGAAAKGEEQVTLWSLVCMFVFSALGGAWFPLEFTGQTFSAIGHLTPSAWAMDGFQNIIVRELGLRSIGLPAGILLIYATAFFGLAVWRFRCE
jgi:ABC-2 type transport system permease protein